MVVDYCIIGGGISGLYKAYKLAKQNPKASIHVYQDSDRMGGRIYTHTLKNGDTVDMGAGRIATHHPHTMQLLQELKLKSSLIPIPKTITSLTELKCFANETDAFAFLVKIAKTALKKLPKKYTTAMSFLQLSKIFFSRKLKKIQEAIYVTGYDTEFEIGNAWVICSMILDMYQPDLEFAVLKGGLSRIIDELMKVLKKRKRVTLYENRCVYGWKKRLDATWDVTWKSKQQNNSSMDNTIAKHIHVATGVGAWEYWTHHGTIEQVPVSVQQYLEHIKKISLCRVYATYEDTKWIQAIQRCVTKTPLRYIIPISDTTIMISYLDGEKADELSTMDDETLREWVKHGISLAFPGLSHFIPEPTEIKRGYWNTGIHIWGPMRQSHPPSCFVCDDDTFSFSGEAFSMVHQGWIEGALVDHTKKN